MNEVLAFIGATELQIPATPSLERMIKQAHKRMNYQKVIAAMRKAYRGDVLSDRVQMDSDFFFALEDVMGENGYFDDFHDSFEKLSIEKRKMLYGIIREDKTVRYFVAVRGYEEEYVKQTIYEFFNELNKKIK